MTVLLSAETKVICQGLTGRMGTFHGEQCLAYGTKLVAGVRPGKGGVRHLNLPVFDTVAEAKAKTGATASMIFVPPPQAASAMLEAIRAEMSLIVCVTERVPVLDMVRVRHELAASNSVLVGPNSQGILIPDVCKLGVMPTLHAKAGGIAIISRSASLTSEVVEQTSRLNLGQSITIGIGGDPVHGLGFVEALQLCLRDPDTRGIILLGEIGGYEEEAAAVYVGQEKPAKPVVAYVAGRHAPPARRLGHAGTVTGFATDDAIQKIETMLRAGIAIAANAGMIGATMKDALKKQGK